MKFLFLSGHAHLALDPASTRASGGAELQVALLAKALAKRGHEVVIAAADTGQKDGVAWEGVRVRTCGRYDTGGLVDSVKALPRLLQILREESAGVVVVYGWTAWLWVLGYLRNLVPFRLVFVCALDTEIDGTFRRENPVRGWLFAEGMRAADARFGITEYQAKLFREQGMKCEVTRLLLQDVKAERTEKSVDLLWVARCHPVKNPQLFLDLAERFPEARCRMICSVQDRVLWDEVSRRAAGMKNVEFFERVPYRDIQGHFSAARIFLNTSAHEGVPNTFIHSGLGHCAIASLSVDPDGMFKVFEAGGCARGDFEGLAKIVGGLLGDGARLRHAQDEAARYVREWHDNARNVDAFLKGVRG